MIQPSTDSLIIYTWSFHFSLTFSCYMIFFPTSSYCFFFYPSHSIEDDMNIYDVVPLLLLLQFILILFSCMQKSDDERFRIQMNMKSTKRTQRENFLKKKMETRSIWWLHIYKFSYLHFIVYLHGFFFTELSAHE